MLALNIKGYESSQDYFNSSLVQIVNCFGSFTHSCDPK